MRMRGASKISHYCSVSVQYSIDYSASLSESWCHSQLQVSTQLSSTRSSEAIMPISLFGNLTMYVGETLPLK